MKGRRLMHTSQPGSGTPGVQAGVYCIAVLSGVHRVARLVNWRCQYRTHEVTMSPLQAVTRKTRVLDVVYNASNNELVGCHSSA